MPRKLFLISIAFIIGTVVGQRPDLWVISLGCFLVLLLLQRSSLQAATLAIAVVAVLLGGANGYMRQPQTITAQHGEWRGRAVTTPDLTAGGSYRGLVDLEGTNQKVMVYFESVWNQHDLLLITGSVAEPMRAKNPGELDYQALLSRQGVNGVLFATEMRTLGRYPASPLDRMRNTLQVNLSTLAEPARGLAQALVLGDRRGLARDEQDKWRLAGASHLLAVSGLHVSIVGGLFYYIMRRFTGMRAAWLVSAFIVVFYALIIGSSASAWRAAITFVLLAVAHITLRTPDWLTTFSFVAALMLAITPQASGDPGFQLSFAAASGIVYLSPFFSQGLQKYLPRKVAQLVAVSFAAQLSTLPIISIHFHTVPLYGLVTSVLLVPLAPLILTAGVATALLGGLPFLGHVVAGIFGLLALLFSFVIGFVAAWPMASVNVIALPVLFALMYFSALSLWPRLPKGIVSNVAVICTLFCLTVAPVLIYSRQVSVTVLSVGNADAIHLKLGAKHYLIDTADAGAMARAVVPYLRSQGVNRVRGVFITHTHNDHVGGLKSLIQVFPTSLIYSGPEVHLVEQMAGGIPVISMLHGLRVDNPAYTITAISSTNPRLNLNNRSAILSLEYGEISVLFAGDLETEGEAELMPYFKPVHVLKVGHHGSDTSTGSAFLQATKPQYAAISVGANRYGHPSLQVIERLHNAGATVLRTDEQGAIRFVLSGSKVYVQSFSQGKFRTLQRLPIMPLRGSSNVYGCNLSAAS